MKQPKVSVIVPVYKTQRFLKKCLESILCQTLKDIEVIVVDEGDMDECRSIIDYFESVDKRVIAPHTKNGGYGASCNKGIEMAKGEYIAIVESDDFIEPSMYEELYEYAKKVNADVVKSPYYEYFDELDGERDVKRVCAYGDYITSSVPDGRTFSMKNFPQLLTVHASLWTGLYRTGYMREKNIRFVTAKGGAYVDVGFRIDTLVNTEKVAWYPVPFYDYRITNEDSTTNNFNLSSMISRWEEVYKKYGREEEFASVCPHLLKDEYLNTLGWIADTFILYSDEDYGRLVNLYQNVSEHDISEASSLTKVQKQKIMEFKKDPAEFKKMVQKKREIMQGLSRWQRVVSWGENGMRLSWLKKNVLLWGVMCLITSMGAFDMFPIMSAAVFLLVFLLEIVSLTGVVVFYVLKVLAKFFRRDRYLTEVRLREMGLMG